MQPSSIPWNRCGGCCQFHDKPRSREELEGACGPVWNEQELRWDFEVCDVVDSAVNVRCKSDGALGSLSYRDHPGSTTAGSARSDGCPRPFSWAASVSVVRVILSRCPRHATSFSALGMCLMSVWPDHGEPHGRLLADKELSPNRVDQLQNPPNLRLIRVAMAQLPEFPNRGVSVIV